MARTHGGWKTPEYRSWAAMLHRCKNAKHPYYKKYYVDKGIKVCERWRSFENFFADMGPKPSIEHSIDRINNEGDYEPGNCRWATPQEQSDNRGDVPKLTFNGATRTVRGWAKELGVSDTQLRNRLRECSVEEALSKPLRGYWTGPRK